MSAKQSQITSFFQNKKQKICEGANNHAVSSNNSSINFTDEENVNPAKERSPSELVETSTSTTITIENGTQFKCELLCCTYYGRYVPEKQSDLKSTNDARSCPLGCYGKVYCYYYRKAHQSGYHPQANKMSDYSFTVRGFNNWKNGLAKFEKHEKSVNHTDCVYLVQQQRKPPVVAQISSAHQHQQAQRRRMLLIQIKDRRFYSIICDEATDESGVAQLCFTIRSVDDQFIVHEDVIGLYQLTSQSAEHITEVILNILIRCDLDIKLCRGQGFDGASTMSGHLSGISTRIKNLNSKAYYIHCNANSLDLALQDLTRESPPMASTLDITNEIVNFMKKSSKRLHLLDKLTGPNYCPNLKSLCPTRWTVRESSMDSLVVNYDLVKISLDEISAEDGPPSAKANGYLEQMQKFSTYFGLKLILNALDLRFQQSVFPLLCKVEKFIIAAANGTKEDDNLNIESIVEFLNDDIEIPRLKC
ncbi:unnamed protein product [Rotaria sp. Silwood2]|nr:unnamed protein product [Rotaria sp. Silwood2]CAF4501561.1 unnamed protein product [Rotaria sp. Silwood2]